MRYTDIKRHLKPYSIIASRTTTINHAFAAAIAPHDVFDLANIREALGVLGQNADRDLLCAYCGNAAETWDHVYATVKNKLFSGHGHRIGNLLPCCKPCNSKKGNKYWRTYLQCLKMSEAERLDRAKKIDIYIGKYTFKDQLPEHLPEYQELQDIKKKVMELLAEADRLAVIIRDKSHKN